MESKPSPALPFILLAVLSLIWGSSFILMKRGLIVFTPMQVAALRVAISGVLLAPFAVRALLSLENKRLIPYFLLCGALGNAIPAILFTTAQKYINSSTGALLNSLTPISTLLLGVFIFKMHTNRAQTIGVFIGFLGAVALVLAARGEIAPGETSWYALLPVVATICYGMNANLIGRYLKGVPSLTINSLALFGMTLFFLPYLILSGFFTDALPIAQMQPMFGIALMSIITLSVLGTALSNALYTRLIQISSPVFSSSVTYLIPVVAMAWGLLDGEHLSVLHFVGILIILAGIYLVNKR